jgi:hypothetical protein
MSKSSPETGSLNFRRLETRTETELMKLKCGQVDPIGERILSAKPNSGSHLAVLAV